MGGSYINQPSFDTQIWGHVIYLLILSESRLQNFYAGNEKWHVQTVSCILHHSVELLARPSSLRWCLALLPLAATASGLHAVFSLGVLPEKEPPRNQVSLLFTC